MARLAAPLLNLATGVRTTSSSSALDRSLARRSDDTDARKVARRCFGLIGRRIDRDAVESRVSWESIAQDTKVRGSLSQGASRVRACVVSRTGPSGIE